LIDMVPEPEIPKYADADETAAMAEIEIEQE
jgi:hypothetical protein